MCTFIYHTNTVADSGGRVLRVQFPCGRLLITHIELLIEIFQIR